MRLVLSRRASKGAVRADRAWACFSRQLIEKGDSSARMHAPTRVGEHYMILEGRGTLRFNGRSVALGPGDPVGRPTGPDAATYLIADGGERLRMLDTEMWSERSKGTGRTAKDLTYLPVYEEAPLRAPGGAVLPSGPLFST